MPRSLPLVALAALLLAGCTAETRRPNIVFIFSDDHARHAISAYGSAINETPNIDRIASGGLLFTHNLVTNAICAPSRATVLTGTYNHVNGQITNAERFDGGQVTFPKLLQAAGYQTALVGKWHLGTAPTGFDYWRVLIDQGPYYNPQIGSPTDTTRLPGYTTDLIADLSFSWLEQRDPERPFLLMFQHKAPHRNWKPGPDHLGDYADVDVPMPETFYDDYSGRTRAAAEANMRVDRNLNAHDLKVSRQGEMDDEQRATWDAVYEPQNEAVRAAGLTGEALDRWKYQRYAKDYLRSVQSLDDNIGRLLDWLDASGLAENTIVVYASDQGWYLGEHGWYDKRWMYDTSLRAPLLVRWPGRVNAGTVSDALVSNVDFAATLLDVAGVEVPATMQGRSLMPIFEASTRAEGRPLVLAASQLVPAGPPGAEVPFLTVPPDPAPNVATPDDWRKSFYYHYYEYPASHCVRRHYGVRTERHKLIHFYTLGEWELFDLERDPDELQSVYGDPAYAEVQAALTAELSRLRSELAVPEDTRPGGEDECTSDSEGWDGFESE